MDFLSYWETGHIGGPSGKGHIRALDIGGIRRYREISRMRWAGGRPLDLDLRGAEFDLHSEGNVGFIKL